MKVAVIGAGRMGKNVAAGLPPAVDKLIIDRHDDRAQALARQVAGSHATDLAEASTADIIAIVLPAPEVNPTIEQLLPHVKPGAILLNMATSAEIDPRLIESRPEVSILDAKIIGHAMSLSQGSPCLVVVNTESDDILDKIRSVLTGFQAVVAGDSELVARINTIGSREGIRTAVRVRQLLKEYQIPKAWEDIVIYTVCAGTMRSYVEDDLGHFARELADQLEAEAGIR